MKKLSRNEMKVIKGGDGYGPTTCSTNADCANGEKCAGLVGLPKICMKVDAGASCTTNSDCGNGKSCVNKPYPATGKWCA